MSSVTKNPLYLQSANYIYSFFLTNKNIPEETNKSINTLEIINSDKNIIQYLKKQKIIKEYSNVEARYSIGDKNNES